VGLDFNVFLIYSIYVPALYWVTFAVNLIGLVLALWLDIYLVSRSLRLNIAWLTTLTLWLLSEVFLTVLLVLNPPPRDWYSYLILKDAYIEEVSNREIMMRLYISEGTLNRTRRGAVRSLARAMGEMEAALS
jgi:hypothetical protein